MKFGALFLVIFMCSQSTLANDSQPTVVKTPPEIPKRPHKMKQHGVERIDNYYWLRDDSRTDPEILKYLEQWNEYTEQKLKPTEKLQDTLFQEMIGRIEKDTSTVPYKFRNYYYHSRYEGDNEYSLMVRQKKLDRPFEVILDANKLSSQYEYFSIGTAAVHPEEELMAYTFDQEGRRIYTLKIKNLKSGRYLNDELKDVSGGSVLWSKTGDALYYLKKDPQTLLSDKLYRHKLNTPQSADTLVYEEKDKSFYTSLAESKDFSELYILHSSTDTAYFSKIIEEKDGVTIKPVFKPTDAERYGLTKHGDEYYLLTNWDAKNNRIMKVAIKDSNDKKAWQEVIAHRDDVLLTSFDIIDDYLVLVERERGQDRLRIRSLDGKSDKIVEFDESLYSVSLAENYELDSDWLRINYRSYTTPSSVYDINVKTLERKLLKQTEVPGYQAKAYQAERQYFKARDGVDVPVSILYKKELFKKDGTNPILVYGYGSYGSTMSPHFSSQLFSLLDRGFVYAIAHIRGSKMLGETWYETGKLFKKKNTFYDFIDVTKALVAQKYGHTDKVFARGGSAGGLLMGAIINMEPSLYLGVGAHVPFVDVVTTMSDPSIPLTTNEYSEWGNPADKDAFEYMLSYSPYDQVKAQNYPNLLVTTGLHDSQVQYFEPAKWVAKLQDMKTDTNDLLFKVNMDAGHSGASGRFKRYKDLAMEYAYFISLLEKSS